MSSKSTTVNGITRSHTITQSYDETARYPHVVSCSCRGILGRSDSPEGPQWLIDRHIEEIERFRHEPQYHAIICRI